MGNPNSSNTESSTRLPEDLITEILLRLPMKPLVKFKCVSKPWLSLISSPQFMKSHFSKSSKEGQHFDCQLLFTTDDSEMKHCSLASALRKTSNHVFDIEYPYVSRLRIVGIVNGLVCVAMGETLLYLWNPILKKSKRLPSLKSTLKDCGIFIYGFGYDESNDDYKVVKVPRVYGNNVKVYTLRGDSWRGIETFKGFKGSLISYINGKYANGKIFWTIEPLFTLLLNLKIVSLDLVTEKFKEVQGPVYEAGSPTWEIGVIDGCLSVLFDYSRMKADLWVMDKCGLEESWSKVVSIPYDDVHPARPYILNQALWITRNGEVVFEDKSVGLTVYDSKSKEFRNIQLSGYGLFSEVFVYVESFISPNDL